MLREERSHHEEEEEDEEVMHLILNPEQYFPCSVMILIIRFGGFLINSDLNVN